LDYRARKKPKLIQVVYSFSGHLSFTLCFGKKCCAINNADNWLINWQWDHLDEFHNEDLQECEGFEVEYTEEDGFPYHGQVTVFHSGRDGWLGMYVRVLTDTGVYWQCPISEFVDENEIKVLDCKIGVV
jgi:hypothetical protein